MRHIGSVDVNETGTVMALGKTNADRSLQINFVRFRRIVLRGLIGIVRQYFFESTNKVLCSRMDGATTLLRIRIISWHV